MVAMTLVIWVSKSILSLVFNLVMVVVSSVWILLTLVLMILVKSALILAMIWSRSVLALVELLVAVCGTDACSGSFWVPFWFLLDCFCLGSLGYLLVSKIKVGLVEWQGFLSGDLFHCVSVVVAVVGALVYNVLS